jgi:hypothetical protein
MRRARLFSPFIALVLLAACGGTPSESAGGDTSQEPGASQPAASQPSASQPAASQGGGGGGGGINVTLSDGNWTGGSAQVTVSGDATEDIDAPLQSLLSLTGGASTTLSYISSNGQAVVIAIYTDSFAVSVTTGDMTGGGGTTTTCDVTWHSTDDNNISADFSCPDSPAFTTGGTSGGTIDIEGSFTATR